MSKIGVGFLGNHEFPIKKKFRWIIQFFKDGVAVREADFVRIHDRPAAPISYPENVRFELGFSFLWRSKGWMPEDFNQVELKLVDGCGNLIEKWLLKDTKFHSLQSDIYESEEYDLFMGMITYGPDIEHENVLGE